MNTNWNQLKDDSLDKLDSFSRWISGLSWVKFLIFIILIAIASDHIQMVFTDRPKDNWFGALTGIFIVFCFGSKLLISGKVKAEDAAIDAIEKAQKEALARQISEAKVKVIQSQIDPHFLFNTLATLQYLIGSDPKKAQELLTQTVSYLRYVLPNEQDKSIVNLGEEIKASQAYLEIMKFRLTERFSYEVNVNEYGLNQPFPYTVIQNLLDSAIRYGIEPNIKEGYIKIHQESESNTLVIENSIASVEYATQQINDIYLKNIITTIKSLGYHLSFDVSHPEIIKVKIQMK